jgi:hypothetical protein
MLVIADQRTASEYCELQLCITAEIQAFVPSNRAGLAIQIFTALARRGGRDQSVRLK